VAADVPTGYRLDAFFGPVAPGSAPDFAAMCTLMERDVPIDERDHGPTVFTAVQVLRTDEPLAAAG
jgi:hypothetical protein